MTQEKVSDDKLGRFDHHPDPAIDFEIEVQCLEARLFDAKGGISKPGTKPEDVAVVLASIERAMTFRVGGDTITVAAKQVLRRLETEALEFLALRSLPHSPEEGEGVDEEDLSSDDRWNAGVNYAIERLCEILGVDAKSISWDAATETLDGDVMSVICNVMAAAYGEEWTSNERDTANIRAALASPQPSPVSVNGLEWYSDRFGHSAESVFGTWWVRNPFSDGRVQLEGPFGHSTHLSSEAAMAAAQATFNTRILSALSPQPETAKEVGEWEDGATIDRAMNCEAWPQWLSDIVELTNQASDAADMSTEQAVAYGVLSALSSTGKE